MLDTSLALLQAALLIGSVVFVFRYYSVSWPHNILPGFLLVWFNLAAAEKGLQGEDPPS